MTKKNAIKHVCEQFNLSVNCIVVEVEYKAHYTKDWHAIILQHYESDTSYLVTYNNEENYCDIKQYKGIDNEKRFADLYEYIIA